MRLHIARRLMSPDNVQEQFRPVVDTWKTYEELIYIIFLLTWTVTPFSIEHSRKIISQLSRV